MRQLSVFLLSGWILWGIFKDTPMHRGWYPTEAACLEAGRHMNHRTWAKLQATWPKYQGMPSQAAGMMMLWDAEYECHPDTVDLWTTQPPPK